LWSGLRAGLLICAALGAACPTVADGDAIADAISDSLRPAVVGTLSAMVVAGNDEMSDTGRYGFDAVIASSLVAEGLKRATDQPRPNDPEANDGFPSGHVTTAFAFARVLSHQYPDTAPYVYGYALATAWSRLELERHDWVQVLAGAALGTWLANESVHREGGLLFGMVAPERRPGERRRGPPMAMLSFTW